MKTNSNSAQRRFIICTSSSEKIFVRDSLIECHIFTHNSDSHFSLRRPRWIARGCLTKNRKKLQKISKQVYSFTNLAINYLTSRFARNYQNWSTRNALRSSLVVLTLFVKVCFIFLFFIPLLLWKVISFEHFYELPDDNSLAQLAY